MRLKSLGYVVYEINSCDVTRVCSEQAMHTDLYEACARTHGGDGINSWKLAVLIDDVDTYPDFVIRARTRFLPTRDEQ